MRVIADIHDTIYPGLVSTGKVEQGSDKPFHTVINGENFHALEALTFTHRHKIDAIYIDPPYNSGAKGWKYNNHYVDKDDSYRHSKWLAMMERRLLVAKQLLNPEKSVLIVAIDEKEYLRLGLLLEQLFGEPNLEMVTAVVNSAGARKGRFSPVEEYLFFVYQGTANVENWQKNMLDPISGSAEDQKNVEWLPLRLSEPSAKRGARPDQFYPIFVDEHKSKIVSIGNSISNDIEKNSVPSPDGTIALWPLKPDGTEMLWGLIPSSLEARWNEGFVKVTRGRERSKLTIKYLAGGTIDLIKDNKIIITGRKDDNSIIGHMASEEKNPSPKRVWNLSSHKGTSGSTRLLSSLTPQVNFPYAKSLYAVEDTIRFFVADNPNAIILDFFAGSGTTAHAVMRLNRQDGGRRQSISITNNEVSDTEAKALTKQKYRQGDADWEKWGICDYITKPRIKAAITGETPEGKAIAGDYKFTDEFPMAEGFDENAEFFDLTYESPLAVDHNLAFERIAPLLWIRAGSTGRRIEAEPPQGWDVADTYGLLTNLDKAKAFCEAISLNSDIRIAYIVTDDDRCFQSVAQDLPPDIEKIRLYESYLTNFQFAHGG